MMDVSDKSGKFAEHSKIVDKWLVLTRHVRNQWSVNGV